MSQEKIPLSRQQKRAVHRWLDSANTDKKKVFIGHLAIVKENRRGLRGRLMHYFLDRTLGISRRNSWKWAGDWVRIDPEVST